jgi:hypothetical protein
MAEAYKTQNALKQYCQLADGEAAHPVNYRGCSHAKEEMRK